MADNEQIRVLVVDDEFPIRMSLEAFLRDYDFEVSSASSAEEALALLQETVFHAAVIDLRLPGMSGETLILQAHEMFPHLGFIIHTGSSTYRLPIELKRIGISSKHLFFKPMSDLVLMIEAIEDLVKREKKNDQR